MEKTRFYLAKRRNGKPRARSQSPDPDPCLWPAHAQDPLFPERRCLPAQRNRGME